MRLRRFLFTSWLVLITGISLVFPVQTFAAEDLCECYCSVEGTGATRVPDESTKMTSGKCSELCRSSGNAVATCAYTPNQKPQYNTMCFTPDECASQKGLLTASGSGKPSQPGECQQGMYYCYPDPSSRIETTLQVSIGDLKVTGDLGEYIASVYKWMLGVGTTLAIVFMMVAGLRWTFGGLSAEQVGKAKQIIQNAMIGLVLLMLTYLILFTVNPYLVRLQVPAFPMIKQVSVVGQESCGFLTGVWGTQPYLKKNGAPYDSPYAQGQPAPKGGKSYTLENQTNGTACGSVADVVKDWEGKNVTDNQTCTSDYCPKEGENIARCFGQGSSARCFTCTKLDGSAFAPSSSDCAVFSSERRGTGNALLERTQCFWTRDPGVIVEETPYLAMLTGLVSGGAGIPLVASSIVEAFGVAPNQAQALVGGVCAQMQFECRGKTKCSDYDKIPVVTGFSTTGEMDDLNSTWFANASDVDLGQLCTEDPCGLAPPEEICQAKEGDVSLIADKFKKFDCKNSTYWTTGKELDQDGDPIH